MPCIGLKTVALLVDSAPWAYFQDHYHAVLLVKLIDYPPVTYPDPEHPLHPFHPLYVEEFDWCE